MKYNRIIGFIFAGTLALLSMNSCFEKNPEEELSFIDNEAFLKLCTPVYKGIGYALGEKTEDLTMYHTDTQDEYYIPHYFLGGGELFFTWDRTTNTLSIEESYTGMSRGAFPIYIMSQKKYDDYKAAEAQRSFFDFATNTFNLFVLMETADDNGIIYLETNLVFEIKSAL